MAAFVKFPRTPHLFLMPGLQIRNDKVMELASVADFLKHEITIEEKVDGANVGISVHNGHTIKFQNRGNYLEPGAHPQFKALWQWATAKSQTLISHLSDRYILFGEWCLAKHTIHYTMLPDYFLAFDLFDRGKEKFLSTAKRNALLEKMNIASVPFIAKRIISREELTLLVTTYQSALYEGPVEGLYLRRDVNDWLEGRAKLVRAEFIQEISQHWSKGALHTNSLWNANTQG